MNAYNVPLKAEELPPPTKECESIVGLIGAVSALSLIEAKAGQRLYIPKAYGEDNILSEILDAEACKRIIEEYPGLYLKVPVARQWLILCYRARGLSYGEIAAKTGRSQSAIWRVINKNGVTFPAKKRTRRADISEKVAEQILTHRSNGMTIKEISVSVKCPLGSVASFLKDKGLTKRHAGRRSLEAAIIECRQRGLTYEQIAKVVGCGSSGSISKVLGRQGLLRSRKHAG